MAVSALESGDGEVSLALDTLIGSDEAFPLDAPTEDIAEIFTLVDNSRYITPRDLYAKSRDFAMNYFFQLPDVSFRQLTRMTKPTFLYVLSEIKDHPIFHNKSNNEQADVWLQLAVALDRFGNYGNGVSLGRTLKLWGIGKGTVSLYSYRVMMALKFLQKKFVVWPNAKKRKEMSRRMQVKGFKGCVGFIDGTTFPLSQKPAVDGECYFDRKSRYSINAQVVCDDQRRIIAFYSGWPGSCSDSTVYRNMQLAKPSSKPLYFSEGQYLIADSAYPADRVNNTLVPAYKKNMKGNDIEAFNTCVAHVRVVNEHTIGVLKGRWSSLKELRIQLNKKEDMRRLLDWVNACVVLHNMVITYGDDWYSDDDSSGGESSSDDGSSDDGVGDDTSSDENDEHNALAVDEDPFLFRRRLKVKAIGKGKNVGGILWYRANFTG
eukprot:jgi/Phyca11/119893/e_gw1.40.258.1